MRCSLQEYFICEHFGLCVINPLSDMPILGSYNSVANKDMSKI